MRNFKPTSLKIITYLIPLFLFAVACDSGSDTPSDPTGTLTATVGGSSYSASTISILTNNGFTVSTRSDDGQSLSLTFLEINAAGQYPLINRALTPGQGVAGGYNAAGETYNIDAGTVSVTAYSNSRISGTFVGTANGLLGAPDLPVIDGTFDIQF